MSTMEKGRRENESKGGRRKNEKVMMINSCHKKAQEEGLEEKAKVRPSDTWAEPQAASTKKRPPAISSCGGLTTLRDGPSRLVFAERVLAQEANVVASHARAVACYLTRCSCQGTEAGRSEMLSVKLL